MSVGLLACLPFGEVHADGACVPTFVTELFFSNGEVQPGIYLGIQKISDLPKQVTENTRISGFLSGFTDSTFLPLIVIGSEASSSNYRLQLLLQENGDSKIVWVQRKSSDIGLMVLGHPIWLGLWQPQCAEIVMTLTYGE
jgi:hypothetical protein